MAEHTDAKKQAEGAHLAGYHRDPELFAVQRFGSPACGYCARKLERERRRSWRREDFLWAQEERREAEARLIALEAAFA